MELLEAKKKEAEAWLAKQPPSVEVAAATASGAAQGGLIGALMATFSAMEPPPGAMPTPKVRASPRARAPPLLSRHLPRVAAAGHGRRAGGARAQLRGHDGRQRGAAVRHQEGARRRGGRAGQVRAPRRLHCDSRLVHVLTRALRRGCVPRRAAAPCSMAASFGAGAAFSMVSAIGAPVRPLRRAVRSCSSTRVTAARRAAQLAAGATAGPAGIIMDAVRTGAVFSLLQGAFYQVRGAQATPSSLRRAWAARRAGAHKPRPLQVGNMMSGGKKTPVEDVTFLETRGMLYALGLQRYEKNFQKGQLDDFTLSLLTDSALKEVKIPPGPRLRILDYASRVAYSRAAAARVAASRAAPPNSAVGALSLALPLQAR